MMSNACLCTAWQAPTASGECLYSLADPIAGLVRVVEHAGIPLLLALHLAVLYPTSVRGRERTEKRCQTRASCSIPKDVLSHKACRVAVDVTLRLVAAAKESNTLLDVPRKRRTILRGAATELAAGCDRIER